MMTTSVAIALLLSIPAVAAAQHRSETSVVVFAGTGKITPYAFTFWVGPTFSAGGGVDHRFASGVLLQGEVEMLTRPRSPGDRVALLPSFNVGFASAGGRVPAFVSGGYTPRRLGPGVK